MALQVRLSLILLYRKAQRANRENGERQDRKDREDRKDLRDQRVNKDRRAFRDHKVLLVPLATPKQ